MLSTLWIRNSHIYSQCSYNKDDNILKKRSPSNHDGKTSRKKISAFKIKETYFASEKNENQVIFLTIKIFSLLNGV